MKKILLLLVIISLCAMSMISCSLMDAIGGGVKNDPVKLAEFLDEENYYVTLEIDVEEMCDDLDIKEKDVCCVVNAYDEKHVGESGSFIICESEKIAEDVEDALDDYVDENDYFEMRYSDFTIEREGNVVFYGCEDVWEIIK